MRAALTAAVVLLGASTASAQCFAPGFGWGFGFAGPHVHVGVWGRPVCPPVWGWGYGYSYSAVYVSPWAFAPPVMPVPLPPTPGVFTVESPPVSGGVDLVALRDKLAREREAEQRKKAKVDAAAKNGEFVVFEPGRALPPPKRAEAPPAKIPDSPPKPGDPKAAVGFHLKQGQAAFDAGELGRATERFAAAVAADPKLGEGYFNLAQVRMARGQFAEAVDAIRAGMKAVPDWANKPFRTNDLYLAHPKRFAADVADLMAAVEATPADSTLAFLYAHHLWFSGEKPTAADLFRKLDGKVKDQELIAPFLK